MKKNGIYKNCAHCSAQFYVQTYRSEQAQFCSMKCLWNGRRRRKIDEIECICEYCKETYVVRAHRKDKTRFCSKRCGMLAFRPEREAARLKGMRDNPRKKMDPSVKSAKKAECNRLYYLKNKEKVARYSAARYEKNRDQMRTVNKAWRGKNTEKIRETNRKRREVNGERVRANRRQHYRDNKPRYVANARKREERVRLATPSWADHEKIAQFYVEAARLTAETGIKHHVDHFYPLRSKIMCGLHVETNLQILPAIANLRKSNSVVEGLLSPIFSVCDSEAGIPPERAEA